MELIPKLLLGISLICFSLFIILLIVYLNQRNKQEQLRIEKERLQKQAYRREQEARQHQKQYEEELARQQEEARQLRYEQELHQQQIVEQAKRLKLQNIQLNQVVQQYDQISDQYNLLEQDYKEVDKNFTNFKIQIQEEEEKEKEIARRRYVTPKLKKEVLIRDNYTCQICGISRGFLDSLHQGLGYWLRLEVDHKLAVSNGGSGDSIDNLQCLCWRCNAKKNKKIISNEAVRELIKKDLREGKY